MRMLRNKAVVHSMDKDTPEDALRSEIVLYSYLFPP